MLCLKGKPETYKKFYSHFRRRLKQRYGIDISLEEYILASLGPYEDTGVQTTSKRRKMVWVKIKGYRVLAIKRTDYRTFKALVTCLPEDKIHQY